MALRAVRFSALVAAAAALTTALLGGVGPAPADAAPAGNVVVLGDSFASNPKFFENLGDGCHRNPKAWPGLLDSMSTARVDSFACANTTVDGAYNLYDQAALARGVINRSTRAVLIQIGFNSFGGGMSMLTDCYLRGCPGGGEKFPRLTAASYVKNLKPLVTYVRYYAPKARIAIVGYPELYAAGQRDMCVKVPGGARVTRPGTSAHPAFMRKNESAQAGAAAALKISFVSLATVSRGHGMCANDSWITGYFHPFKGLDTGIQGHPTSVGDRVAARTVKTRLGL